jgi:hypothetical protein
LCHETVEQFISAQSVRQTTKECRTLAFRFAYKVLGEPNCADSSFACATIGFGLVLDLLTFCQTEYCTTLQRGGMNENIWSTGVWLDKSEALLIIEEFHCSSGHCSVLRFSIRAEILMNTARRISSLRLISL